MASLKGLGWPSLSPGPFRPFALALLSSGTDLLLAGTVWFWRCSWPHWTRRVSFPFSQLSCMLCRVLASLHDKGLHADSLPHPPTSRFNRSADDRKPAGRVELRVQLGRDVVPRSSLFLCSSSSRSFRRVLLMCNLTLFVLNSS